MNDLRSPMEDRPYRPADRQPSHMTRDEDVMSTTEYYRSRLDSVRQSRWFPLASVFAAVLVFSGVISYAYKQGSQSGVNATTPIVEATDTAFKEKPANPGGMDVPFQDAIVFDQLQGKEGTAGDTIESLLPPPEQPIATDTANQNVTTPNTATDTAATTTTTTTNTLTVAENKPATTESNIVESITTESSTQTPSAPQPSVSEIPTVTAETPVQKPVEQVVVATKTETVKAVETKTAEVKSSVAAQAAAATKAAEQAMARKMDTVAPAAASATQHIASGDYRVQLGAFRDEPAARAAWSKFQRDFSSQLSSVTPDFPRADLGAKGVFYRVQGKNLSKASADSICASINASRGGSCMVTR